jgi:hypothetical protein
MQPNKPHKIASKDFRHARRNADVELLVAWLTGRSASLLCFRDISRLLNVQAAYTIELHEIPVDAIVGSVERCSDYTRSFRPMRDIDQDRWASVNDAIAAARSLPPIKVYQLGDIFFVVDGHHRVSAARQQRLSTITALVMHVETQPSLSPDIKPDDITLQAECAAFLASTGLDERRPGVDFRVTAAGQHAALGDQIAAHHAFLELDQKRVVLYSEAVDQWYDDVYLPVIRIIRRWRMMRYFPGRTETDLYLWLRKHRANLEETIGWTIELDTAAADLVDQFGSTLLHRASRFGKRLLNAIKPFDLLFR